MASLKPNAYFDFSASQITYRQHPQDFYRMLRRFIDDVGPWRVFFGTDGPLLNFTRPPDSWVQAIREPDLTTCPEVSISEEKKEIIPGKAFARLLDLSSKK